MITLRPTNDAKCGFYSNEEQGVAIDGEDSADVGVSQDVQGDSEGMRGENEEGEPSCQERQGLHRPRVRVTSMSTSSLIVRTARCATTLLEARRRMMLTASFKATTQMQT